MDDRSPYLERGNLILAGCAALVLVGGAGVLLGPARASIGRLNEEIADRQTRLERWDRDRVRLRPVAPEERRSFASDWGRLTRQVPLATDEPNAIARLGRAVQRPGVRSLDVQNAAGDVGSDERSLDLEAQSPDGKQRIRLLGTAYRVEFRSDFETALRVLQDLESRAIPARIEALEMRRVAGELSVRFGLTVFSRSEEAS
ncbi:MAG: hypothetical protein MJE66_03895 [Proteobacteria bacterium]|nr:hypothetical protein [Pseudomonadota bacterium]